MNLRNAIGIDPDAKGFVCALVNVQGNQRSITHKRFSITSAARKDFITWVQQQGDVIVALEGIGGQSSPIEASLINAGIEFYSFPPIDIAKERDISISKNKDNARDAEATAHHAISLEINGTLKKHKRTQYADEGLRSLTRTYERVSNQKTASINALWKLLHQASSDVYIALSGNVVDSDIKRAMLDNIGILRLFIDIPDIAQWNSKSNEEMHQAMGGKEYANTSKHIAALKTAAASCKFISPFLVHAIKTTAEEILFHGEKKKEISCMIESSTTENKMVQALLNVRGIGIVSASCIVAEIITIARFASDDNLASYSGFGRLKNTSGDETKNKKTKPNTWYNRRLKDAFMNAARFYLRYNKESHLAAYYKHLLSKGMKPLEALKRVARGLVRKLYQTLKQAV